MKQMEQSFSDFDKEIRKVHSKRNRRVFKVFYIKHIYRSLAKNDPTIKQFTCEQMYNILYDIGKYLLEEIIQGKVVKLPYGIGELYIACTNTALKYNKDKNQVSGLKINWIETNKLWYNDPEAKKNHQVIKYKPCKFFTIKYKRGYFTNSTLYKLVLKRPVKLQLRDAIINNELTNAYEYGFSKFESYNK